MRGISWLAEKLLASQEGLNSMELILLFHQRMHINWILTSFINFNNFIDLKHVTYF
jgi:hypothetical protein